MIPHEQLRRLAGAKPIAEASENVVLTERSGKVSGIIAVETENRQGTIRLDGTYRDMISGAEFTGKVDIAPYGVLVLVKK